MITAKEAEVITDNNIKRIFDEEITDIEQRIRLAAYEGRRVVVLDYEKTSPIFITVQNYLISLGYDIHVESKEYIFKLFVSWGKLDTSGF